MKILAFDTSTTNLTLALYDSEASDSGMYSLQKNAPMQQSQQILPELQTLLNSAKISINQLDAIAFGCGPGSFTGTRIAASVAQGLGFAASLPLIPISSLAILAQTLHVNYASQQVMVVMDAHGNQVYWGMYQANSGGVMENVGEEGVHYPENLPKFPTYHAQLTSTNWAAIGNGWAKYATKLNQAMGVIPEKIYPLQLSAEAIILLAKAKIAQKRWISVSQATPNYLTMRPYDRC